MSQWKILGRSDHQPGWVILDSFPSHSTAQFQLDRWRADAPVGYYFVLAAESQLPYLPIRSAAERSAS
jgi:hypothetical protein